jgi:adenosylhomocysteine/aminodeoxyfutalosine nucleosidase
MKTIGIIGAMEDEITPLLEYYKEYETINLGKLKFYKVTIQTENKILYITQSKIGKVSAAIAGTTLITKFNCDTILFTGVAGANHKDLEIGDLVIGTKLVHHDVDITAFGHKKGHIPEIGIEIETNQNLNQIAEKIIKEKKYNYKTGTIATGDQFVHNKQIKKEISENFNAIAIEMEGVAVAQTCNQLEIPCFILRAISDNANGDAPENFIEFVKQSAIKSSTIITQMIKEI